MLTHRNIDPIPWGQAQREAASLALRQCIRAAGTRAAFRSSLSELTGEPVPERTLVNWLSDGQVPWWHVADVVALGRELGVKIRFERLTPWPTKARSHVKTERAHQSSAASEG